MSQQQQDAVSHTFSLARRSTRLRTLVLLALVPVSACKGGDNLTSSNDPNTGAGGGGTPVGNPVVPPDTVTTPDTTTTPDTVATPDTVVTPGPDTAFVEPASGMPFGFFRQPSTAFGKLYTGGKQTMGPGYILGRLEQARVRGGRILVMLVDKGVFYKDPKGHFSLDKWKQRIDRYRGMDLSRYIDGGTIMGHLLLDEPQDKKNWNGEPIPGSVLEEMARYSKEIWPNMLTIIRAPPGKIRWNGTYRYLDAAWAQIENPKGNLDVKGFLDQNIADARSQGLALTVGLNVSKGNLNHTMMTPGQIRSWGSVLLNSSYPCAFISWQYDERFSNAPEYRDAMQFLSDQAQSRPNTSCRGSNGPPAGP